MKPQNKEELLDMINKLPDDFEWFSTKEDANNCINVKIFTENKDSAFYDWYFGL